MTGSPGKHRTGGLHGCAFQACGRSSGPADATFSGTDCRGTRRHGFRRSFPSINPDAGIPFRITGARRGQDRRNARRLNFRFLASPARRPVSGVDEAPRHRTLNEPWPHASPCAHSVGGCAASPHGTPWEEPPVTENRTPAETIGAPVVGSARVVSAASHIAEAFQAA